MTDRTRLPGIALILSLALLCVPGRAGPRAMWIVNFKPGAGAWAPGAGGPFGAPGAPGDFASGAVALRPDVRYVPSGSVLDATATVSADRRYVTITAGPQLSRLQRIDEIEVDLIGRGGLGVPRPAAGARAVGGGAVPAPALGGRFATIAKQVGIGDHQKKQMAFVWQEREKALAGWNFTHGVQLCSAEQACEDAAPVDATRTLQDLHAARDKITDPFDRKLMNMLTPVQRERWYAHQTALELQAELAGAKLTDAQKDAITSHCRRAAKNYLFGTTTALNAPFIDQCRRHAREHILTAAQRAKLGT